MLLQLIDIMVLLLLPVGAIAIVDDWFLRPRRRLIAHPAPHVDPPLVRLVYGVLPVFIFAGVVRLFFSQRLDFSLVLLLVVAVSLVVFLADVLFMRPLRRAEQLRSGKPAAASAEPVVVDYARSFLPVALAVLILRAFLFEPFRIPSDSMMPTLYAGDFILVNKFAYGIRLPVINTRVVDVGTPNRGDVVVFRYPPDPAINYVKRVVGLPGDRVRVLGDRIYVNGEVAPWVELPAYSDGCYEQMQRARETIGEHVHEALYCNTLEDLTVAPYPSCKRSLDRGYFCSPSPTGSPDHGDRPEYVVPEGQYFMVGDNRDNSADSRYWGFVPDENLVGRATRIWLSVDFRRGLDWIWGRMGRKVD
jgi:signal peptidase I